MTSCATLAAGADDGTKMTERIETLAHIPASALPALPDEAVVMTGACASVALTTASALGRSLNEAVGLRPSSLMRSCLIANCAASRGQSKTGVQPTASGGTGESSAIGNSGR